MATAKITVIFYVLLSLMAGGLLIVLPWFDWGGLGDVFRDFAWVNSIMNSGWVRGAVTGLGVLNIFLAFTELANFNKSVEILESQTK
jgi:hypothetical protein